MQTITNQAAIGMAATGNAVRIDRKLAQLESEYDKAIKAMIDTDVPGLIDNKVISFALISQEQADPKTGKPMDETVIKYTVEVARVMAFGGGDITPAEARKIVIAAHNTKGVRLSGIRAVCAAAGDNATAGSVAAAIKAANSKATHDSVAAAVEAENVANGHAPAAPRKGRPPKSANAQITATLTKVEGEGGTLTAAEADAIVARIKAMVK
jgi:hypothetical protein